MFTTSQPNCMPQSNSQKELTPSKDSERISQAREIIKKFPVTKNMFPQANFRQTWIVCK